MTEVIINVDSGDREGTIASFVNALEIGFGLPPAETRPGVEAAFDAHSKVLEVLMDHTDPEKVGMNTSVAAMFAFREMEVSHARSVEQATQQCVAAAAILNKVEHMIGDK